MKKKLIKTIISFSIIGVAVIAGYFGWRFLNNIPIPGRGVGNFRLASESAPAQPASSQAASSSEPVLAKISEKKAFDIWAADGDFVYYIDYDGRIFKADSGVDQPVSSQTLSNLRTVLPSVSGRRVLAGFGGNDNPQWGIFDVIDGVWRPLPQDILQATWGKDENEIIALKINGGNVNLVSVNTAKSSISFSVIIKDFRMKNVFFTWRPPNFLMITEKPSAEYKSRVWQMDLKKLTLVEVFSEDFGQDIRWSNDGRTAAKFVSSGEFSILNSDLEEVMPLFFSTLPEKCALGQSVVYCFAPQNLPEKTTLPDDYFQKKFRSVDDVYEVNLFSEDVWVIFNSNAGGVGKIDGWRPVATKGYLYFINQYDGFVYRLRTALTP